MQGYRLHIIAILAVLLSANQLGAKNHGAYQTGKQALRDRADYCQYIDSASRQTRKNPRIEEALLFNNQDNPDSTPPSQEKIMFTLEALQTYLGRSVRFHKIPKSWKRHLSMKRIILGQKIKEMRKQVESLSHEQVSPLNLESSYDKYRKNHQLPLQAKTMVDAVRKLEHELSKLTDQNFSSQDLLEIAAEIEGPNEVLGLEFVRNHGWFSNQIKVFPAWRIDGRWIRASHQAWLELDDRFLPESSFAQLKKRHEPKMIEAYKTGLKHLLPDASLQAHRFYWNQNGNFVVSGSSLTRPNPTFATHSITTTQDLSVFGMFDLACLSSDPEPPRTSKFRKYFKALAHLLPTDKF